MRVRLGTDVIVSKCKLVLFLRIVNIYVAELNVFCFFSSFLSFLLVLVP